MAASPPPSPPLHPTFPIIAVAIIGILATAFLLVSYYIFVIKCCLNWHRIDLLHRFSFSRRRRRSSSATYTPPPPVVEPRGLNPAAIRSLPVFTFKNNGTSPGNRRRHECAVCLNDFRESEKLRKIPDCAHVFHIDCIDVWLQNNANCPLCRASISPNSTNPTFLPQNPNPQNDAVAIPILPEGITIARKKVGSMDDEWIETDRKKDVQPMRRSFSMDSAGDTQLCQAVREIVERHRQGSVQMGGVISPGCEGSSSRGNKKSFFSFGQGRGNSRTAVHQVQPVFLDP